MSVFYKFLKKKEQKKPRKVNISEGFRTCDESFAELSERSDLDGFQKFTANYVEKSNSGDVRITNELFTKENKKVYNCRKGLYLFKKSRNNLKW